MATVNPSDPATLIQMKRSAFLISPFLISTVVLTALSSCQPDQPTATQSTATQPTASQPTPTSQPATSAQSTPTTPVPAPPDFEPFRQRLLRAAQERDVALIRAIASPDIRLTFGRPDAPDPLNYFLKLDDPNTLFWPRLERVLTLGCAPVAEVNQIWQCPNSTAVPTDQANDSFTAVFTLGEVKVQAQPHVNSAVIEVVTNAELKLDQAERERFSPAQKDAMETLDSWFPVITPAGNRGYVSSRQAFSPVGYRALFEPKNGDWQMVLFLAGD